MSTVPVACQGCNRGRGKVTPPKGESDRQTAPGCLDEESGNCHHFGVMERYPDLPAVREP